MGSKKSRVILEMDEELQRELEAIARDNERSVPGELRTLIKQAIALKKNGRTLSDADVRAISATVAAVQAAMKSDKSE